MAQDLRNISQFPHFHNFTGALTWTEIKIPEASNLVMIGSLTQPLWIAQNGASDGAVVGSTNKGFIPKGNYLPVHIGIGLEAVQSIYVASQTGSPNISIILQEAK